MTGPDQPLIASPGRSRDQPTRVRPRLGWLGRLGFRLCLPLIERIYAHRKIYRLRSAFARRRISVLRAKLERGETLLLAGLGPGGTHNSGVALVEVSPDTGPRIICNNEEERFSGEKHSARRPKHAMAALRANLAAIGRSAADIDAWFLPWDYPAFGATLVRAMLEEAPPSLALYVARTGAVDFRSLEAVIRTPRWLATQMGRAGHKDPEPVICLPHHDTHAWFSYAVSPFARDGEPAAVAVLDGFGDSGAISLYLCAHGEMKLLRRNDSIFDSLGLYYAILSSTQGGWTMLTSEGRYMGAAAYGNGDRATNPYYARLRGIFVLGDDGGITLNRGLANWPRSLVRNPYTPALAAILGEPIPPERLWNPDAVLRVEDIRHRPETSDRLDKAAAVQMVFEDALTHVVEHLIRDTQCNRLVLTGGTALNAVANMRLLDRFDESWFERAIGRRSRLHLWVPPVPNDAGVTIGAAFLGAHLAGAKVGAPLEHAFYCGSGPTRREAEDALEQATDAAWHEVGSVRTPEGRKSLADLMAFVTANDGILAVMQGAGETGPRALGHRSILANPCNPATRDTLNARVKFREAVRPLAPMMTLEAAHRFFELSDGASDDAYNAYNYMVLTARAKPGARDAIPAVVHADGTGRIQIVRETTDPLTHAYLQALGRRIGVEVAVNTSFNVGGPIVQTVPQALDTLRRSKGIDAVLIVAAEGPAFAVWLREARSGMTSRFPAWLAAWQMEVSTGEMAARGRRRTVSLG